MGSSFETADETALETCEETILETCDETALDASDTAEEVSRLDTSDETSFEELSPFFGAEQPQRQATRHRHSAAENIFFNILSPLCSFNTRKSIFY